MLAELKEVERSECLWENVIENERSYFTNHIYQFLSKYSITIKYVSLKQASWGQKFTGHIIMLHVIQSRLNNIQTNFPRYTFE